MEGDPNLEHSSLDDSFRLLMQKSLRVNDASFADD